MNAGVHVAAPSFSYQLILPLSLIFVVETISISPSLFISATAIMSYLFEESIVFLVQVGSTAPSFSCQLIVPTKLEAEVEETISKSPSLSKSTTEMS